MAYTKYLVSGAVAVALLAGCGSDSDKKENTGLANPVAVTVENAADVTTAIQGMSYMSLMLGVYINPDEMEVPSSPMLSRVPKLIIVEPEEPTYPIEQNCSISGNYVLNYTSTETSETYTETYNQCVDDDGTENGTLEWVFSENDGVFTKEFDADVTYTSSESNTSIDLVSTVVSNVPVYQMMGEPDYINVSFDGSINEGPFNFEFDKFKVDFNISADPVTVSVNGGIGLNTPPIMEGDANCSLIGAYNVQTIEELEFLDSPFGDIDKGSLKINGATFDYNGSTMSVTIGGETTDALDQGGDDECLGMIMPF